MKKLNFVSVFIIVLIMTSCTNFDYSVFQGNWKSSKGTSATITITQVYDGKTFSVNKWNEASKHREGGQYYVSSNDNSYVDIYFSKQGNLVSKSKTIKYDEARKTLWIYSNGSSCLDYFEKE